MAASDEAEKEFDPTPRRLDQARAEGDVPRSADLTAAAAQAGLLLALLTAGGWSVRTAGTALLPWIGESPLLAQRLFQPGGAAPAGRLLAGLALPLLPVLLLPALAALAAIAAQQGFAVSGTKLLPKLDRINPIANAKNKFGLNGLFDFGKSAVKLTVVGACLIAFLLARLPELIASAAVPWPAGLGLMTATLADFLMLAVAIAVTIGGIDLLWQRFSHRRKLRMSRQDLREELKQSEGDPHLRQERRQRGFDIAGNRMLQDVAKADVVIVNPTHFAVALRWDRAPGRAPVCVAKGMDQMAARIRERAAAAGVPIHRDPAAARALYATTRLGAEIAPDHYRAVAAAIRFAEAIRRRARSRG